MQTPGGRRRAQCQMLLVPPARPAGLERGGGMGRAGAWPGRRGRGQAKLCRSGAWETQRDRPAVDSALRVPAQPTSLV